MLGRGEDTVVCEQVKVVVPDWDADGWGGWLVVQGLALYRLGPRRGPDHARLDPGPCRIQFTLLLNNILF